MAFAVFKTVVGRFSASQVGSTPMHLRHSIENGPKIWRCIVSERQDIRRGESVVTAPGRIPVSPLLVQRVLPQTRLAPR